MCHPADTQGKAIAIDLISRGKKVLLVGRSESTLSETCKEINAAGYYTLDVGDTSSLPAFVDKVIKEHPDLDCLINNAGVQKPLQVLGPDYDFDLSKADQEIDINIRGPVHLSVLFIQKLFQNYENGAVVMNVSSALGFIPFSVVNPVYNGTKSFLHSYTVNLRTQLAQAGSKIKIVEIVPPQVESDLHRDRKDPDDNKKSKSSMALSIEEFMQDVRKGWEADEDVVAAGMAKQAVQGWQGSMGKKYDEMMAKA
jgi:short-subunit dehydrogenase involved in D-alanine esterification of teichoic acids